MSTYNIFIRPQIMLFPLLVLVFLLRGSSGLYLHSLEPHPDYRGYDGIPAPSYSPSWSAPNEAELSKFGYNLMDNQGNQQYRYENSDYQNTKTGMYGYRDVYGIFRHVTYIADGHGFRVVVDSNEPGTAPEHPADAVFNSAPIHVPPVRAPNHFAPAENIWYQGFGNEFGRRIGSESSVGLEKRSRRQRRKNRKGRRLDRKQPERKHQ